MPKRCPDEKCHAAKAMLDNRESLIREVRSISKEIARLTKLREETRTEARRLKVINRYGEPVRVTEWRKA